VTPQPPAALSTLDIALWFRARSESAGDALSQRELHLLLYVPQAHYAAEYDGQKLMPAVFLALDAEPMEPNIFQLFASGRGALAGNDPSFGLETYLHEIWARYAARPASRSPPSSRATACGRPCWVAGQASRSRTRRSSAAMAAAGRCRWKNV